MISESHIRIGGGCGNVKKRNSQIKVGKDELYPGPVCAVEVLQEVAHSSEPFSGVRFDLGSRLQGGGKGGIFSRAVVTLRADRNTGLEKLVAAPQQVHFAVISIKRVTLS